MCAPTTKIDQRLRTCILGAVYNMNGKRFMNIKRLAQCSLLLAPGLVFAAEAQQGHIDVAVIDAATPASTTIRLEARHARLEEVIDAIARKTGVRVHQRDLPEEFVSAMCAGSTVQHVLECLLGPSANLVVRYLSGDAKNTRAAQPTELWVLGKSTSAPSATMNSASNGRCDPPSHTPTEHITVDNNALANAAIAPAVVGPSANDDTPPEVDTRTLINLATADDPAQRADAVAQLAVHAPKTDRAVRQTIQIALQDESPEVRAQAVFGLAGSDDAWAVAALEKALQDEDVNVRLMAVDSAGANAKLLQDALSDADETVRSIAALRLGTQ